MRKFTMFMLVVVGLASMSAVLVTAKEQPQQAASAPLMDSSGRVIGNALFTAVGAGSVRVQAWAGSLTPGVHGIHVHAVGSCSPDFAAAGGHHNPTGAKHGTENPEGPHAGDLPNLVVGADGNGALDAITNRITLTPGPRSIFDADGSALVIHASADDYRTDPTGNSGARIACGVIEALQ